MVAKNMQLFGNPYRKNGLGRHHAAECVVLAEQVDDDATPMANVAVEGREIGCRCPFHFFRCPVLNA